MVIKTEIELIVFIVLLLWWLFRSILRHNHGRWSGSPTLTYLRETRDEHRISFISISFDVWSDRGWSVKEKSPGLLANVREGGINFLWMIANKKGGRGRTWWESWFRRKILQIRKFRVSRIFHYSFIYLLFSNTMSRNTNSRHVRSFFYENISFRWLASVVSHELDLMRKAPWARANTSLSSGEYRVEWDASVSR